MKKPLVLSFSRMSDINLQIHAMQVGSSLIDNEFLPAAGEYGKELVELSAQFLKAMSAANLGDLLKISAKNDLRALVIKKLQTAAEYVVETAQGNETTLISSGFDLAKHKGGAPLTTPTAFKVSAGPNNGEIILQVKRIVGAKAYLYQYTADPVTPDSKWETFSSTRCKKTLTNLPLGVKLWFRMAVIGPNEQIVYTEVKSRYVA
jgi:hypothetical protein